MMKDYSQQQYHLSKAQDRYYSCCSEWENHLTVMYREYGASWEPTVGNKLYEKEQVISRRVDEVSDSNEWPACLLMLCCVMIAVDTGQIWSYFICIVSVCPCVSFIDCVFYRLVSITVIVLIRLTVRNRILLKRDCHRYVVDEGRQDLL